MCKAIRVIFALACVVPVLANASICDTAWNVDKVVAAINGRPSNLRIPLRDKEKRIHEVTADQIRSFHEAKARISRAAGLTPDFIICDSASPNAFATANQNGALVAVTVGMLRLVDGDRDMAAAVLGHELAHHTKRHRESAASRDAFIGLAGILLGVLVDARTARRTGVATGLGVNLGQIGATLVSRKFDRDQEREADEIGFEYLVAAGFNPVGAIRLAERLNQVGSGVGLFFESHPGWPERRALFQGMIARNPHAQELIAKYSAPSIPVTVVAQTQNVLEEITLDPSYTLSDAQKSYERAIAAFRSKDVPTGVREIRTAAAAGYAPAQSSLGYLYSEGIAGLPKDEVEAARLYRLAADQEDPLGQSNLGFMYQTGRGDLPRNAVEAVRLYRLSSDQGHAQGQVNLGAAYSAGLGGLEKDEAEAVRLYRLAADQGNALARANLALMYALGRGGLTKDEAEAVKLARLSADQGNALGRAVLGIGLLEGRGGLTRDDTEGLKLLRMSANQGSAFGQLYLGGLYEYGRAGLPKSISDATTWYRRAAEQGNAVAIARLKKLGAP